MPTDTVRGHSAHAAAYVVRGVTASLAFFGLLRLDWVEAHVVLPFTRIQGQLGATLLGPPTAPVETTLACSGADALALCLGAVLAYPVPWRRRLAGAGGGVGLILALNTVRIGTLGRAAASPAWFNALHLYLWPAVLTLSIAGFVFAWMRYADREARPLARQGPRPTRRFVLLSVAFVALFLAASPLYLENPAVLALGAFIAGAAATILGVLGVGARAAGNVLWMPQGGFAVTQECLSTPLIPLYLAAICTYSSTWPRMTLGVMASLPLFTALGIVRLLIVAVPDAVASPIFLVHAFYQLLLAVVVVFLAALWRHGGRLALGYGLAGAIAGTLFARVLEPVSALVVAHQAGAALGDPQGAIAMLPAFQVGLYLALWVAAFVAVDWRRFLAGLAVLGFTQAAGLLALQALATHAGLTAHVRDVRAWAVAGPVLIFAAVVVGARGRQ